MPGIFAIGDIHGCCKTFKKLLLEEIGIEPSDKIYCVGDYIDRGNDSKGVIDLILDLRIKGYHIYTLRGNHEQMMLEPERLDQWLENGGGETLKSFGISSVSQLPHKYLAFLKQTAFFIETDKYIFVHAGLNFRIESPFTDKEAMIWTRDEYFVKTKINNKILIHGHTPIPFESMYKQLNNNKINIDGGCVYTSRPGLGNLIALSVPDMKLIPLRNMD